MNVIDENVVNSQMHLLRGWRIRVHQIGHELGLSGMKDEEIIPLLHDLRSPTFFTRDLGFYNRSLCHKSYCIICLAVGQYEVATFIRRTLRHTSFNTRSKRMGKVILVGHTGIRMWRPHAQNQTEFAW